MAFSHGSKAVFKLTDAAATLRDLSAFLTDAGLPQQIDQAETSHFGDTAKEYIVGLSDATIPLQGDFDPTVDGYLAGLIGHAATAFEYDPAGVAVGNPKYTGNCNLSKYEVHTPIHGPSTFTCDLQVTGAITRVLN